MCMWGSDFFLSFIPWYCGFPWNSWSHHLSRSDPNLVSACYKTKITSYARAAAVLSQEHSQVFMISLWFDWMHARQFKVVSSYIHLGDWLKKSSDQVKLEFGGTPSALLQHLSVHCRSGPHVTISHPINYTQCWCCGLFGCSRGERCELQFTSVSQMLHKMTTVITPGKLKSHLKFSHKDIGFFKHFLILGHKHTLLWTFIDVWGAWLKELHILKFIMCCFRTS